jgi:hypothetical protein
MDHPRCRDCGERHPLGAQHCPLFKDSEPKITAKKLKEVLPHSTGTEALDLTGNRDKKEPSLRVKELSSGACPVCEARRQKQLEAQKRYREKKRGSH